MQWNIVRLNGVSRNKHYAITRKNSRKTREFFLNERYTYERLHFDLMCTKILVYAIFYNYPFIPMFIFHSHANIYRYTKSTF